MVVKIKKLHPDAVIPHKTYDTDFCYDCVAISEEEIAPNVWKYGLGIAFQIERGFTPVSVGQMIVADPERENFTKKIFSMKTDLTPNKVNLSIDARPRSSVWKTGMILSNCEGTIDEDYTGEVSAVFYHVMPNMPRYKVGDRIVQIKLGTAIPMEFEVVEELNDTERANGGYGSTGK